MRLASIAELCVGGTDRTVVGTAVVGTDLAGTSTDLAGTTVGGTDLARWVAPIWRRR